jgi:hypothetical protein
MAAARFCSDCGARLKVKRTITLPLRSFCSQCSPRHHLIRLILIAAPVVCGAIGFAIGHFTSSHEPFYFIGTPVDLTANRVQPSTDTNSEYSTAENVTPKRPEQLVSSQNAAGTLCGAQTKSGRPCKRRVKGDGYCWQHRGSTNSK